MRGWQTQILPHALSSSPYVEIKEDGHVKTKKNVFTSHWISQESDRG